MAHRTIASLDNPRTALQLRGIERSQALNGRYRWAPHQHRPADCAYRSEDGRADP